MQLSVRIQRQGRGFAGTVENLTECRATGDSFAHCLTRLRPVVEQRLAELLAAGRTLPEPAAMEPGPAGERYVMHIQMPQIRALAQHQFQSRD